MRASRLVSWRGLLTSPATTSTLPWGEFQHSEAFSGGWFIKIRINKISVNPFSVSRFTFGCCGGDEASGGCRVSHQCCRRQPGSQVIIASNNQRSGYIHWFTNSGLSPLIPMLCWRTSGTFFWVSHSLVQIIVKFLENSDLSFDFDLCLLSPGWRLHQEISLLWPRRGSSGLFTGQVIGSLSAFGQYLQYWPLIGWRIVEAAEHVYVRTESTCLNFQICKKCGAEWGSPANGCFKKSHNLTNIAC